jgi:hypothetical protein
MFIDEYVLGTVESTAFHFLSDSERLLIRTGEGDVVPVQVIFDSIKGTAAPKVFTYRYWSIPIIVREQFVG